MIKTYVLPRNQADFDGPNACTVVCVAWASELFRRHGEMWDVERIVTPPFVRGLLSEPEQAMRAACAEWRRRWPDERMTDAAEVIAAGIYPNVRMEAERTAMVQCHERDHPENSPYGSFREELTRWLMNRDEDDLSALLCTRCDYAILIMCIGSRFWLFDPHAFTVQKDARLRGIAGGCVDIMSSVDRVKRYMEGFDDAWSIDVMGSSLSSFFFAENLIAYVLQYIEACIVTPDEWHDADEKLRADINRRNEIYCVHLVPTNTSS